MQNCRRKKGCVITTYTTYKASKYRVFSGPYFPVLGLNTRKYGLENTPHLDTFHAVVTLHFRGNNIEQQVRLETKLAGRLLNNVFARVVEHAFFEHH